MKEKNCYENNEFYKWESTKWSEFLKFVFFS